MFYAKWFGSVLLMLGCFVLIGLLHPPYQVAAFTGLACFVWAIWLVATFVKHLATPS